MRGGGVDKAPLCVAFEFCGIQVATFRRYIDGDDCVKSYGEFMNDNLSTQAYIGYDSLA